MCRTNHSLSAPAIASWIERMLASYNAQGRDDEASQLLQETFQAYRTNRAQLSHPAMASWIERMLEFCEKLRLHTQAMIICIELAKHYILLTRVHETVKWTTCAQHQWQKLDEPKGQMPTLYNLDAFVQCAQTIREGPDLDALIQYMRSNLDDIPIQKRLQLISGNLPKSLRILVSESLQLGIEDCPDRVSARKELLSSLQQPIALKMLAHGAPKCDKAPHAIFSFSQSKLLSLIAFRHCFSPLLPSICSAHRPHQGACDIFHTRRTSPQLFILAKTTRRRTEWRRRS